MGERRAYAITVVAGILGGGAAFWAASRPWTSVQVASTGMPADSVSVTGAQADPLVGAMALVVMAAAVAVLAAARWLRLVVGVVVVVAAVTGAVAGATAGSALDAALLAAVRQSPSMTGDTAAQQQLAQGADPTAWRWITLALLVLSVAVGVAIVLYGRRWPVMGRRYEAPALDEPGPRASSPAAETPTDSETDLWRALDRGEDPTA